MASKYKESVNKIDILFGNNYETYPRQLGRGEKDYSGLLMGDYIGVEPISIFNYGSFIPMKGWIIKNRTNLMFKIVSNLVIGRMYTKNCWDKMFFGVEYVSSDNVGRKLNLNDFKKEFLDQVEKIYSRKKDKYSIDKYQEYIRDIDKYVKNVEINISTFEKLNKTAFNNEINRITTKYHFKEVDDISSFNKCLYLVVLDEYKQFYVGKSESNLKGRMRKHWTAKIIPSRHLWTGDFESSRIKFDDFKMFDTTRIFVCDDISQILKENRSEAEDRRIERTNTFGIEKFENMNELAIAERIVINNCKCLFCLSDRTPLMSCERFYSQLEEKYKISRFDLLIKQYLGIDSLKQK